MSSPSSKETGNPGACLEPKAGILEIRGDLASVPLPGEIAGRNDRRELPLARVSIGAGGNAVPFSASPPRELSEIVADISGSRFRDPPPRLVSNSIWTATHSSANKHGVYYPEVATMIYRAAKAFSYQGTLYDFGAGYGLILFLGAACGFDAHGHEVLENSVRYGVSLSQSGDSSTWQKKMHLYHGDCTTQTEIDLRTVDVWYLYPALGMTQRVYALYAALAKAQSILLMPGNAEIDTTPLPSGLFMESIEYKTSDSFPPCRFFIVAKEFATLSRLIETTTDEFVV